MNEQIDFEEIDLVACENCLREIPRIDARATEVNDYVINFCGLDCYELWQQQNLPAPSE